MNGGTILIVDDEAANLAVLDHVLAADHRVRVARSGGHALRAAASEPRPDLILLDVMMPRRDGFEVCQEIRRDPALAGVRIAMLTAKGREVEREKGLALGADSYITKPFATQEVLDTVRSLLEGEEAAR